MRYRGGAGDDDCTSSVSACDKTDCNDKRIKIEMHSNFFNIPVL